MLTPQRRAFFEIIGKAYSKYGYPPLCGWIEALFRLEPRSNTGWTQREISEHLSRLFPESNPTSLPSVNRALKILESYSMVVKSGSRKIGYTYELAPDSTMLSSMFSQFITVNETLIRELTSLREKESLNADPVLIDAVNVEIMGFEVFNQVLLEMIKAFEDYNQEE